MPPRKGKENLVGVPALALEVVSGPCCGQVFNDQLRTRRIGRGVKGNAVCIKDERVSQKHAELSWTGEAWELADLGSSNGTLLNGVELAREGDAVVVCDGDVVSLGDVTVFKIRIADAAQPQPPPATDTLTVEAYLRTQCAVLAAKMEATLGTELQAFRDEASAAVHELERQAVHVN